MHGNNRLNTERPPPFLPFTRKLWTPEIVCKNNKFLLHVSRMFDIKLRIVRSEIRFGSRYFTNVLPLRSFCARLPLFADNVPTSKWRWVERMQNTLPFQRRNAQICWKQFLHNVYVYTLNRIIVLLFISLSNSCSSICT